MKKSVTVFPEIQQRIVVDCIIGVPDLDDTNKDCKSVLCKALIDTGAMRTCISSRIANYLEMIPTGTMRITAANEHMDIVNTHIVNITLGGEIRFNMIKVPRISMTGEDLIIGMDLLSQGNIIITNDTSTGTVFMFER